MNLVIALVVAVYVIGVVIFTGLFAFAVFKLGGFDQYAEAGNQLAGREKYTGLRVQWALVLLTLLWPVSIYLLVKKAKAS